MKSIVLTFLLIMTFVNCSGKTHMHLTVTTSQDSNPDAENISSPLMLKFYELKSAEKFSKLDFWTLVDKGTEKLEGDLISQSKHIIVPNSEQVYKIMFDDEAKFLGVIANFQDIENNATWRFVKDLETQSYNELEISIDKYQMKESD